MSRTPAKYSISVVRGSTWEEEFIYTNAAGAAIDLTGYEARMHVREPANTFGTTTTSTLLLTLTTTGANPLLLWDTAANGRLTLHARPDQHAALNPNNLKKAKYSYSIEVYKPEGAGEYVIPLVTGSITVSGEVTR